MTDAWGLLRDEKRDFDAMRRQWLRRAKSAGEGAPGLLDQVADERLPIVAVLLDDLPAGQSVAAAVLAWRSSNEIQVITAYGAPVGGFFKVGFKASPSAAVEWTPNFYPLVDTAETMQNYLAALPSVGAGNVEVTLGRVTTLPDQVIHNTWRWEIVWCGRFAGLDMEMVQVQATITGGALLVTANNPLEPTGRVETIREVLGVPVPTPLKAGARCMALWYHGLGYCVHACEVRDFGFYYGG